MTTLKTKIKSAIDADQGKAWLDHLKNIVVGLQGDLLKRAHSEESDLTWRSAIYSLPRRVLSFAITFFKSLQNSFCTSEDQCCLYTPFSSDLLCRCHHLFPGQMHHPCPNWLTSSWWVI